MAKGRWTLSFDGQANEAYAVLIGGAKTTRTLSKTSIVQFLERSEVYGIFLKLCMEHDDSKDLRNFKKGLHFVVKAIGPSKVAKNSGLNRVTLYRMLSTHGNPEFSGMIRLMRGLGLRMWVVEKEFIQRRTRVFRPKDYPKSIADFEEWADKHRAQKKRPIFDPEDD